MADKTNAPTMLAKLKLLRDGRDPAILMVHADRDALLAPRLADELGDDAELWKISDRIGRLIVEHPDLRKPVDAPADKPKKVRDIVRDKTAAEKLDYANKQAALAAELKKKAQG